MILGVTGPNEYENNVNNNWYTNTIAVWTLRYTSKILRFEEGYPGKLKNILYKQVQIFRRDNQRWEDIINNMHFPFDERTESISSAGWFSG